MNDRRMYHHACFDCEWWHGRDQPTGECYLPKITGGDRWIKMRVEPVEAVLVTKREFFCANWESDADLRSWDQIVEDGVAA